MLFHTYLADMFPHTGGFLIGMAFGIGTRYALRFMRHLGAGIEQQVALTFALGYLSFYTANGPAGVSGPAQGYMSVCAGLSVLLPRQRACGRVGSGPGPC